LRGSARLERRLEASHAAIALDTTHRKSMMDPRDQAPYNPSMTSARRLQQFLVCFAMLCSDALCFGKSRAASTPVGALRGHAKDGETYEPTDTHARDPGAGPAFAGGRVAENLDTSGKEGVWSGNSQRS
jgi:hypothetical protein